MTNKSMKGGADSDYALADRGFYCEPDWCVQALMDAEPFAGQVWDPCAGRCNIPNVAASYQTVQSVHASDIMPQSVFVNSGVIYDAEPWDFLTAPPLVGVNHIIMNPPYQLMEEFIERALGIAIWKVAVIVRESFLHSFARYKFFRKNPPARIYFMSDRPSMPPGEAFLKGEVKMGGGSKDYAWLVYDKGFVGKPTCDWLINPQKGEVRNAKKKTLKVKSDKAGAEGAGATGEAGERGAGGNGEAVPAV